MRKSAVNNVYYDRGYWIVRYSGRNLGSFKKKTEAEANRDRLILEQITGERERRYNEALREAFRESRQRVEKEHGKRVYY